jgi:hypothetical protein
MQRRYTMQWRNTQYREDRYGTPTEAFAVNRAESNRILYCDWSRRTKAARDFLGYTKYVKANDNYAYPSRIIPNYHPKYLASRFQTGSVPLLPYLHCDSIQFEPFLINTPGKEPGITDAIDGGTGNTGNFQEARMHVHYAMPPFAIMKDEMLATFLSSGATDPKYDPGDGNLIAAPDESSLLRYVYPRQTYISKYQTLPAETVLKWSLDGQAISLENVVQLCEADITIKWFDVPQYFWALIAKMLLSPQTTLIGKTNSVIFGNAKSMVGQFPAGTLVFLTPDVEPFPRGTGETSVNVTFRMRYYPFGANKAYRLNEPKNLAASRGGETWTGPGFYGFNTGGGDATTPAWAGTDVKGAFPDNACPDSARLYKKANFKDAFRVLSADLP